MAEQKTPKRKPVKERALDELLAAGEALKDRAARAAAEFESITARFQQIKAVIAERRGK